MSCVMNYAILKMLGILPPVNKVRVELNCTAQEAVISTSCISLVGFGPSIHSPSYTVAKRILNQLLEKMVNCHIQNLILLNTLQYNTNYLFNI